MFIQLQQPLNESSFDGKLNQAINQNHQRDFAFMLACQTQNVAEHAQFFLPKDKQPSKQDQEAELKMQLGVMPRVKLAADTDAYQTAINSSQALNRDGLAQAKLLGYLQNEALSQFNDATKLDDHLVANLDRHTLFRMQQSANSEVGATEHEADATQLYDILNQLNDTQIAI